ncbi:MAG: hypothetical protein HXY48_06300 [Ignavibacteriaceae bacterium]|jgi:hypothetical protein|nr:hypothetical protein [Ignavibacteriaceae bacterium]
MKKKSPFTELLKDEKLTKDSYLFNIEHSRVSEEVVFLKFEVFNYQKKSIFKFKIQIALNDNLKSIEIGKSRNQVGLVNLTGKNLYQIFKGGFSTAIEEGRIPFFPG